MPNGSHLWYMGLVSSMALICARPSGVDSTADICTTVAGGQVNGEEK